MSALFIQIRCTPGKTYEVAEKIALREAAFGALFDVGGIRPASEDVRPRGRGCGQIHQREPAGDPGDRAVADDADVQGVLRAGYRRKVTAMPFWRGDLGLRQKRPSCLCLKGLSPGTFCGAANDGFEPKHANTAFWSGARGSVRSEN